MSRLAFVAVLLAAAGVVVAQPAPAPAAPAKPAAKAQPKVEPKKELAPGMATEGAINVGSKAPGVKADKWVKGSEVKSFESGKVYVIEFWATWCPPCIKSIPLLTELQKSHKEVTVIGMSSSERKASSGADKRLEKVEKFVADKGSGMDYTVAYDGNGTMGKDWLRAAGQGGIPCAFVVDGTGIVTWIGNPLDHEALVAAVDAAVKTAKPATKPTATSPTTTPQPQPKPKS